MVCYSHAEAYPAQAPLPDGASGGEKGGRLGRAARGLGLWVGVGLVYAAFFAAYRVAAGQQVTPAGFVLAALPFVVWAVLSPPLRHVVRYGAREGLSLRTVGLGLVAFAACVPVVGAWYGVLDTVVAGLYPSAVQGTQPFSLAHLLRGLPYTALTFGLVLGVHAATVYRDRLVEREREAAALEAELARAQLAALRMQLHPHFLFNTLNAIAGLVSERPRQARTALAELSELLRVALRTPGTDITLREEVAWLRRYLRLQQLRFEDRLEVEVDISEEVLDARVPGFVLQPLAENAFEHGVARTTRRGHVAVRAQRDGDSLVLDVVDNGPGLAVDGARDANGTAEPGGLGVTTTRARLERLYGARASLDLADREDTAGVRARVRLPYTSG